MKHRGSSKIKYEHDMISGLRQFLERELEPLEYIQAIIPGEINHTRSSLSRLQIRFKYTTLTGAKLLVYNSGAVQEVFVITGEPRKLEERFGLKGH